MRRKIFYARIQLLFDTIALNVRIQLLFDTIALNVRIQLLFDTIALNVRTKLCSSSICRLSPNTANRVVIVESRPVHYSRAVIIGNYDFSLIYSRTSVARTLMTRLPQLFQTRSQAPWKNPETADLG